jgi:hypothetical protein
LHRLSTSFLLGYHGCSRRVGERLLRGESFQPSNNQYDWLGPGIYFWESNPARGLDFAREAARRKAPAAGDAYVVGAVIEPGLCCDLTTATGIEWVRRAYEGLAVSMQSTGGTLPANSLDGLRRNLDCAVISRLHSIFEDTEAPPIDTLRGVFIEGEPLYPGAGFYAKTHVQIVVRNPNCIKGVFRVPTNEFASL